MMSIVIRATVEEARAAAVVASCVELRHIWLSDIALRNSLPELPALEDAAITANIRHSVDGYSFPRPGVLLVKAAMELLYNEIEDEETGASGIEEEGGEKQPLASVRVAVVAEYGLPDGPVPDEVTDENFSAFATFNGIYNCWPYLREEIHRLSADMNVPFVVPVMRILTKSQTSSTNASEEDAG